MGEGNKNNSPETKNCHGGIESNYKIITLSGHWIMSCHDANSVTNANANEYEVGIFHFSGGLQRYFNY